MRSVSGVELKESLAHSINFAFCVVCRTGLRVRHLCRCLGLAALDKRFCCSAFSRRCRRVSGLRIIGRGDVDSLFRLVTSTSD